MRQQKAAAGRHTKSVKSMWSMKSRKEVSPSPTCDRTVTLHPVRKRPLHRTLRVCVRQVSSCIRPLPSTLCSPRWGLAKVPVGARYASPTPDSPALRSLHATPAPPHLPQGDERRVELGVAVLQRRQRREQRRRDVGLVAGWWGWGAQRLRNRDTDSVLQGTYMVMGRRDARAHRPVLFLTCLVDVATTKLALHTTDSVCHFAARGYPTPRNPQPTAGLEAHAPWPLTCASPC